MKRPTPEQWGKLSQRLAPSVRILHRLVNRLYQGGCAPDAEYFMEARRAFDAVHKLSVSTHYLSCEGGVAGAGRDFGQGGPAERWLGDGI